MNFFLSFFGCAVFLIIFLLATGFANDFFLTIGTSVVFGIAFTALTDLHERRRAVD